MPAFGRREYAGFGCRLQARVVGRESAPGRVSGGQRDAGGGGEVAEGADGDAEEVGFGFALVGAARGEVGFEAEESPVTAGPGVFEDGCEVAVTVAGGDDFAGGAAGVLDVDVGGVGFEGGPVVEGVFAALDEVGEVEGGA